MIIVTKLQLEGKKEFCCGKQIGFNEPLIICGDHVSPRERALCEDCFEKVFKKKRPSYSFPKEEVKKDG